MALTDMDFYAGCFGGGYDEEVIMPLLEQAEADIRCVCSDRAEEAFEVGAKACEKVLFAMKWAACLQAEFLADRWGKAVSAGDSSGGDDKASGGAAGGVQTGTEAAVSSLKLGDFSVSFGDSAGSISGGTNSAGNVSGAAGTVSADGCARGNLCGEALIVLDKRGLLYRGGVIV